MWGALIEAVIVMGSSAADIMSLNLEDYNQRRVRSA
jgi:hypothetical protein